MAHNGDRQILTWLTQACGDLPSQRIPEVKSGCSNRRHLMPITEENSTLLLARFSAMVTAPDAQLRCGEDCRTAAAANMTRRDRVERMPLNLSAQYRADGRHDSQLEDTSVAGSGRGGRLRSRPRYGRAGALRRADDEGDWSRAPLMPRATRRGAIATSRGWAGTGR